MTKLPKHIRWSRVAVKGKAQCPSCCSILSSGTAWNLHLSRCPFFAKEFPGALQPKPAKAPEVTPNPKTEVSEQTKRRLGILFGKTMLRAAEKFTRDPKHHPEIWGRLESIVYPPFKIIFGQPSQKTEAQKPAAETNLMTIYINPHSSLPKAQSAIAKTSAVEEERPRENTVLEAATQDAPQEDRGPEAAVESVVPASIQEPRRNILRLKISARRGGCAAAAAAEDSDAKTAT